MLFASDLDNTLIYSYKAAKAGDICVETKDGKELSFMPQEAFLLLKEVAKNCVFVPVTTRTLEQYKRIDLGVKPKYAVVAHGAMLLIDGVPDEKWTAETRQMLNVPLPKIDGHALLYDIRYVDDFFIFAKSEQPNQAAEILTKTLDTDKFTVSSVYNKVYVFPNTLNKGVAVERLKKRLNAETVVCAGDSELDIPMLEAADIAIFPQSLEFIHKNPLALHEKGFAVEMLKAVEANMPLDGCVNISFTARSQSYRPRQ
jgi:hydroxymethylpyrimidine pyrophosphatase-like HAD family hydrolase